MNDVSLLDHADLQCPGGHGQMVPGESYSLERDRLTKGYICTSGMCLWFITQIEFLQNSHGTQEQRRARVANREIGR